MGRAKQKSVYNDTMASCSVKDTYGTVFDSMARSPTYQALGLPERHFYTLCRIQYQSSKGRQCLHEYAKKEHGEGFSFPDTAFVFPATHMQRYGVDRRNGSKLMQRLIEAGFIDLVEQNAHRHRPNVYRFSDRWKA